MSNNAFLKRLGKKWDDAREKVGDSDGVYVEIPTANYVLTKPTAELGEFSTGAKCIKMSYTIAEGEFEGEKVWTNLALEQDWSLEALAKWLNFMQNPIDDLTDLEYALEEITANESFEFEAKVKVDDAGFKKVFPKSVVNEGDASENDLETMSREDLEEEAEELGLTASRMKKMSDAKLMDWIEKNRKDDEEEEDDEEEPDDEETEDEEEDDEEDEEEEEEPTPKSKRLATKKVVKKAAKKAVKKTAPSDDKETIKTLKGLCDAYGIEYGARDKVDKFKESLEDFDWVASELSADEVSALTAVGIKAR